MQNIEASSHLPENRDEEFDWTGRAR